MRNWGVKWICETISNMFEWSWIDPHKPWHNVLDLQSLGYLGQQNRRAENHRRGFDLLLKCTQSAVNFIFNKWMDQFLRWYLHFPTTTHQRKAYSYLQQFTRQKNTHVYIYIYISVYVYNIYQNQIFPPRIHQNFFSAPSSFSARSPLEFGAGTDSSSSWPRRWEYHPQHLAPQTTT